MTPRERERQRKEPRDGSSDRGRFQPKIGLDKASILGEEDGDRPLEHGARQREVSVRSEVAKHVRDTENKEVEEGADGCMQQSGGAELVLRDSAEVSTLESGAAAGVMGLDFRTPTGALLLSFGVLTKEIVVSFGPSVGVASSRLWTLGGRRSDQKRPWAQRPHHSGAQQGLSMGEGERRHRDLQH
ncbi:hypothetical protein B296_00019629 [Ensete ventricosum]|uniref:Uncharacterized protein n=1 Tax=Ensete ventricosum TaxID=4639 RepID=A0A427AQ47_ENSVE|nr:hypothetical protein B296_00019629 [Ensete ventricosum]